MVIVKRTSRKLCEYDGVEIPDVTEDQIDIDEVWVDMPEFNQEDLGAWKSIKVNFKNPESMAAFGQLIRQPLTEKTRSIWYPREDNISVLNLFYTELP